MNEIFLILQLILIYSSILVAYRIFGKIGLFAMNIICTIFANIEVLVLVDAFGIEQTLGNIIFSSTYLVTDVLSENEGKKEASKAVWIGVLTSIMMLIISQYWFLYTPSGNDWAMPALKTIFSTTPRLMLASLLGYIISQRFDVWLYHRWWDFTTKKTGNSKAFLWLRNNGSTMISQLVNTIVFTLTAFAGTYNVKLLLSIMLSSYIIYFITSLFDTPFVYLARKLKNSGKIPE